MPTLTRLALGASAVSALTVFGTALPAAASTPTRTVPHAQTAHQAQPTNAVHTKTNKPTSGKKRSGDKRSGSMTSGKPTAAKKTPSRNTAAHAKKAGPKVNTAATRPATRTTTRTPAATPAAGKSRADLAREARGKHRSVVLHAITAQRRAAARHATTSTTSTTSTTHRTPVQHRVTGGRTSDNWSGYTQSAGDVGRPVTSVSASWHVPHATQHRRGQTNLASDWVGIGGTRSDRTLIQAGTASTVGRAGVANSYTWYETLPSAAVSTPLATHSGDRIDVAIGRVGTNLWRIRMANATTGHSWSTAVRYRSSSGSADFVNERPNTATGSSELPNQTATSFRKAKVNGSSAHFQPKQRVTMTDNGRAISTPSGPEAQGDGFSVCSYSSACGAGSR